MSRLQEQYRTICNAIIAGDASENIPTNQLGETISRRELISSTEKRMPVIHALARNFRRTVEDSGVDFIGARKIDLGSGSGFSDVLVGEAYPSMIGQMTYSDKNVDLLRTTLSDKANIAVLDITSSDLPEGQYDVAMAVNVLDGFQDPRKAIQGARRLLDKDGVLFIGQDLGQNAGSFARRHPNSYFFPTSYPKKNIEEMHIEEQSQFKWELNEDQLKFLMGLIPKEAREFFGVWKTYDPVEREIIASSSHPIVREIIGNMAHILPDYKKAYPVTGPKLINAIKDVLDNIAKTAREEGFTVEEYMRPVVSSVINEPNLFQTGGQQYKYAFSVLLQGDYPKDKNKVKETAASAWMVARKLRG